jgi:hypothetical protein
VIDKWWKQVKIGVKTRKIWESDLILLKITLGNPEGFGYLKKLKIKKWVASYMSLLLLGAVGCPLNFGI